MVVWRCPPFCASALQPRTLFLLLLVLAGWNAVGMRDEIAILCVTVILPITFSTPGSWGGQCKQGEGRRVMTGPLSAVSEPPLIDQVAAVIMGN